MGLASSYTHLSGVKDWQRRCLIIEEFWEDFLLKCEGGFSQVTVWPGTHMYTCNLLQISLIYYVFKESLTMRHSVHKLNNKLLSRETDILYTHIV